MLETAELPLDSAAAIVGSQTPTRGHVPAHVSSRGQEAVELAESVGLHLDEWQRLILQGACAVTDTGGWSALDVGILVPRQSGKTSLLVARELAGLVLFGERLILHSAHETLAALEAFNMLVSLLEDSDLSSQVRRVVHSKGFEQVEMVDGSRVRFRARTRSAGRGFSADCLILDEAQILPEQAFASLVPTQAARQRAQTWLSGTAVNSRANEHGLVFARLRARGHACAERCFWAEWSAGEMAEMTEEMVRDRELWARTNPSLGGRISVEAVERELAALDRRSFAAERLGAGDWPDLSLAGGRVIGAEAWAACEDSSSTMPARPCIAFDVSPDRSSSAIVAAGVREDDVCHVEIIDHRRGVEWVVPRLRELARAHRPRYVVCDGRGPAGSLLMSLERLHPTVTAANASEYSAAAATLVDDVASCRLAHLGDPDLEAAVAAGVKRPLGDAWAWSRRSSFSDITPLCAASLAVWAARLPRRSPQVFAAGDFNLEEDDDD